MGENTVYGISVSQYYKGYHYFLFSPQLHFPFFLILGSKPSSPEKNIFIVVGIGINGRSVYVAVALF